MLERHYQCDGVVSAEPAALFAYLDDHRRLAGHMDKRSWRMGGGRMLLTLDAAGGRVIGSKITLSGKVFGLRLFVEETIVERVPPRRKVWATCGTPTLLVIGPYQMGFEIEPLAAGSTLDVWIDYDLPPSGLARLVGRLFASWYARWCTHRIVQDTARHFTLNPIRSMARHGQ